MIPEAHLAGASGAGYGHPHVSDRSTPCRLADPTREPRLDYDIGGRNTFGAARAYDVTVPSQTRSLAEARQIH
jgi:hypothetical protein